MTDFFAHSENDRNEKHTLPKHLHRTAEIAETFACQNNYKLVFKIAGLLHDLGKYQPAFQRYLINGGRRLMLHGAPDTLECAGYLNHLLRLTGIIKDFLIMLHGRVIRKLINEVMSPTSVRL